MSHGLKRIEFVGLTTADLVRQCKAFISRYELMVATPTFGTFRVTNTWPVPSWAPKGSQWAAGRAPPPILLSPSGDEVAVKWVAGTAQKPRPILLGE